MLFGEAMRLWRAGKVMTRPLLPTPVRWDNGYFFTDHGLYRPTYEDFHNYDWHEVIG
jgi:hypothetical protein